MAQSRMRSLLAIGLLVAAGTAGGTTPPPPDLLPPTAQTVAGVRAKLDATATTADYDAVVDVAQELDDGNGKVTAQGCRKYAAALDAATRRMPLSLAMWYFQSRCAEALGAQDRARQSEQAFAVVLREMLAGLPPDNGSTPVLVGSANDGTALVHASGEKIIYSYFDLSNASDGMLWRLGLRDDAGHERAMAFDILALRLGVLRSPGMTRSPAMRIAAYSASAKTIDAGNKQDDSVPATLDGLDAETKSVREATLARMAARSTLSAAIVLARYCVPRPQQACTGKAIDRLLGYAENGYAEPMLVLAYAYGHARDIPRDQASARTLLQGAAKKIGTGQALAEYLRLDSDPAAVDPTFPQWLLDQLVPAADKGDALAAGLALQVLARAPALKVDDGKLDGLRRQATAAGLGYMVQWQRMAHARATGDGQAAVAAAKDLSAMRVPGAMRMQAEAMLGDAYLDGDLPGVAADPAAALQWLRAAGQDGNAVAMRLVGLLFGSQTTHPDSMQLAAEWLTAANLAGDVDAALGMASIAEHDPPGFATAFDGKPGPLIDAKKAVELYTDIETRMPGTDAAHTARRQLAQMLVSGTGVERDLGKARALLTADAQAGDPQSILMLAEMLYSGRLGAVDADGAKQWLAKIPPKPEGVVATRLADRLYLGYELPVDRPRALALWKQAVAQGDPSAWNDMAWAMCTAADAAARDPAQGLDAARRAVADAPQAARIDTLAACQATSGDFQAAIASQQKALAMLDSRSDGYARMSERLKLYQSHRIYIEKLPDAADKPAAARH